MSHELGITQQVLDIAVEKAAEASAKKVKYIDLVIGDMSGFMTESVQFYFDFLANGSIASGAQLRFRHIPIEVRCRQCSRKYLPVGDNWNCPDCGARDMEILTGKEFFVESIEVE
jgi:hydrogenase nickel incorporation protein HypA/HybF